MSKNTVINTESKKENLVINSKKNVAKKQVAKKESKKVDEVTKINFAKFAERLSKVVVSEKKKKEHLYIYPENFTLQMINNEEGKKFRNKKRNIVKRFVANILTYFKTKNIELLKKEISSFQIFYKESYLKNDYSINSISNAKDEKTSDIVLMLDIVKEFINK